MAIPAGGNKARYALGVLLGLLALDVREAGPGEEADLIYGEGAGRRRLAAGDVDGWDEQTPLAELDEGLPVLRLAHGPPDLVYATYALLTAPWERADPADEVGCPVASDGWLARNGLLGEPLVHRYAERLAHLLGLEPPRRRPAIVLTHDVDDNFAHLFGRRERAERLRRDIALRRPGAAGRRAAGLLRSLVRRRGDPDDSFDAWAAAHRGWGSRPTYFAASYGLFQTGTAREDVAYDVRHPEVRETLRRAVAEGAEIGLHCSIRAAESSERLRAEREALEDAVGTPVRSARHHWWALGRPPEPAWRRHAVAGIELDCSLGFNDRAGFRRGIAAPFRPFDPETGREVPLWTLPTIAMDAAVEGLDELRILYRAVKEVGGAFVLDWHAHSWRSSASLRAFIAEATSEGARLCTPLELLAEVGR